MCVCHYFGGYLHNFIPALPHNLSVSQYPFVKSAAHTCTGWARHRPPTQRYIKLPASLHRSTRVSKRLLKGTSQFREKQRLPSLNYSFLCCAWRGTKGGGRGVIWKCSPLRSGPNCVLLLDLLKWIWCTSTDCSSELKILLWMEQMDGGQNNQWLSCSDIFFRGSQGLIWSNSERNTPALVIN